MTAGGPFGGDRGRPCRPRRVLRAALAAGVALALFAGSVSGAAADGQGPLAPVTSPVAGIVKAVVQAPEGKPSGAPPAGPLRVWNRSPAARRTACPPAPGRRP